MKLDVSRRILRSPIFDPVTGFGGDGVPGTYTLPPDPNNETTVFPGAGAFIYKGCVGDGPFKDWMVHLGPGKMNTDHCLVRGIQEFARRAYSTANVERVLRAPNFEDFRNTADELTMNGIHGSGHAMVGGEMTNTYSAGAGKYPFLIEDPPHLTSVTPRPVILSSSWRIGSRVVEMAASRSCEPLPRYIWTVDSGWQRQHHPRF